MNGNERLLDKIAHCSVTIPDLAEALGYTASEVQESIDELEEKGFIVTVPAGDVGPDGTVTESLRFFLTFPKDSADGAATEQGRGPS